MQNLITWGLDFLNILISGISNVLSCLDSNLLWESELQKCWLVLAIFLWSEKARSWFGVLIKSPTAHFMKQNGSSLGLSMIPVAD